MVFPLLRADRARRTIVWAFLYARTMKAMHHTSHHAMFSPWLAVVVVVVVIEVLVHDKTDARRLRPRRCVEVFIIGQLITASASDFPYVRRLLRCCLKSEKL